MMDALKAYLTQQIPTYLGNKRALLDFIGGAVAKVGARIGRPMDALDLFAGSGVVSRYLKTLCRSVAANDLEEYSRVLGLCYLANRSEVDCPQVGAALAEARRRLAEDPVTDGFIRRMYAPADDADIRPGERAFYTVENAVAIDTIASVAGEFPWGVREFLLAPLIHAASVHVNTSGVFKAFHRGKDGVGLFGGKGGDALNRIFAPIMVQDPVLSPVEGPWSVLKGDAREVRGHYDLAYLDPPYNQIPYGSNYFMLNLIADYREPAQVSEASGIPRDWNRSDFNRRKAAPGALLGCIEDLDADFVILSFSEDAFLGRDELVEALGRMGRVEVLERGHKSYMGGRGAEKRSSKVVERLYVLEKT